MIAVSEFGRDELHELLNVPLQKIDVIHHGVERVVRAGAAASRCRAALEGRSVPALRRRPDRRTTQKLPAPLRSLPARLRRRTKDRCSRWRVRALRSSPASCTPETLGDDVVADGGHALRACYRGALALTIASYHETFGMPMLEAMACGTPVVASSASALPEIAGEAALYAPPDDAGAWAEALQRIVDDLPLRERLARPRACTAPSSLQLG